MNGSIYTSKVVKFIYGYVTRYWYLHMITKNQAACNQSYGNVFKVRLKLKLKNTIKSMLTNMLWT